MGTWHEYLQGLLPRADNLSAPGKGGQSPLEAEGERLRGLGARRRLAQGAAHQQGPLVRALAQRALRRRAAALLRRPRPGPEDGIHHRRRDEHHAGRHHPGPDLERPAGPGEAPEPGAAGHQPQHGPGGQALHPHRGPRSTACCWNPAPPSGSASYCCCFSRCT